jgi:hypothetical protein
MASFEILFTRVKRREFTYRESKGLHVLKLTTPDGREFNAEGQDIEGISAKMLDEISVHNLEIAEQEKNYQQMETKLVDYAKSRGEKIEFILVHRSCLESSPCQYNATAKLKVGEREFGKRFNHWNEVKMNRALVEQACKELFA